jgi:hypothetical protein
MNFIVVIHPITSKATHATSGRREPPFWKKLKPLEHSERVAAAENFFESGLVTRWNEVQEMISENECWDQDPDAGDSVVILEYEGVCGTVWVATCKPERGGSATRLIVACAARGCRLDLPCPSSAQSSISPFRLFRSSLSGDSPLAAVSPGRSSPA